MSDHSPPDPLHALLGMRDLLAGYCGDALDFMARCLSAPAPDSRLARSLQASDQIGTYTVAWQHLLVATDHLQALIQTLHGTAETVVIPQAACFTLERGSLESSSYALWLLNPDITESASVSRALIARVHNIRERQKIDANDVVRDDGLRHIASVARAHGLHVEQKGDYPTKIGSTTRPRATDVCGDALALIHTPGQDYRWVYQFLSGYAHGQGYALSLNVTEWQTVGQLKLGTIAPPAQSILLCGVATARVHHKALELLGHHAGYDDIPPDVAERSEVPWF
jgi:hypothetical protein